MGVPLASRGQHHVARVDGDRLGGLAAFFQSQVAWAYNSSRITDHRQLGSVGRSRESRGISWNSLIGTSNGVATALAAVWINWLTI